MKIGDREEAETPDEKGIGDGERLPKLEFELEERDIPWEVCAPTERIGSKIPIVEVLDVRVIGGDSSEEELDALRFLDPKDVDRLLTPCLANGPRLGRPDPSNKLEENGPLEGNARSGKLLCHGWRPKSAECLRVRFDIDDSFKGGKTGRGEEPLE